MLATEDLLHLSPEDALVEIVNYYNSTGVRYGTVTFEDLQVIVGKHTRVKVKAKPGLMGDNKPVNSKNVTFHRIDLDEFLTPEDREVTIALPASTADIVSKLVDTYGIVLSPTDFLIELIPAGATSFTLRANPQSLRWYGSAVVNITPGLPDLGDILTVGVLPGLVGQPLNVWLRHLLWQDMLSDVDPTPLLINVAGLVAAPHSFGLWYTVNGGTLVVAADTTQTSAQMYTTMLNAFFGNTLAPGDYTVDPPVPLVDNTWNTRTVVHGVVINQFTGTVNLDYNRFDLGTHFPQDIVIDEGLDTMGYDTVAYLNTLYDTNISEVDDVDVVVTPSGYDAIHVITAKAASLGWVGSITITVNLVN